MDHHDDAVNRMAALLKRLRLERRISQLQLADQAGVHASVVHRAERGSNARLSTWSALFDGLGYRLTFDVQELCEEEGDLLSAEAAARQERRLAFSAPRGAEAGPPRRAGRGTKGRARARAR